MLIKKDINSLKNKLIIIKGQIWSIQLSNYREKQK